VAWTLADLAGVDQPDYRLVEAANQLRSGTQVGPLRSVRVATTDRKAG
jgi:hypothetical protein